MIDIENKIVSLDIVEQKFCCNLDQCKGMCCVDGDSGAPLEKDELDVFEKIYPIIKSYIPEESRKIIETKGFWEIDADGDYVTPLVGNKECVYVYFENEIAKCAIEKAYFERKIKFRKPISCHLFPIRITKYDKFDAVNYSRIQICKSAVKNGEALNLSIAKFLKEPLIRKYGKDWYEMLEIVEKEIAGQDFSTT